MISPVKCIYWDLSFPFLALTHAFYSFYSIDLARGCVLFVTGNPQVNGDFYAIMENPRSRCRVDPANKPQEQLTSLWSRRGKTTRARGVIKEVKVLVQTILDRSGNSGPIQIRPKNFQTIPDRSGLKWIDPDSSQCSPGDSGSIRIDMDRSRITRKPFFAPDQNILRGIFVTSHVIFRGYKSPQTAENRISSPPFLLFLFFALSSIGEGF